MKLSKVNSEVGPAIGWRCRLVLAMTCNNAAAGVATELGTHNIHSVVYSP